MNIREAVEEMREWDLPPRDVCAMLGMDVDEMAEVAVDDEVDAIWRRVLVSVNRFELMDAYLSFCCHGMMMFQAGVLFGRSLAAEEAPR